MDVAKAADLAVDQILALAGLRYSRRPISTSREVTGWSSSNGSASALGTAGGDADLRDLRELQPDLGRRRGLPRIAAIEDHVLHALAAEALGALLAQHPGDGVDDVALAAAVGPDNGRDAIVETEFGAIRETLEAGDVEPGQSHGG